MLIQRRHCTLQTAAENELIWFLTLRQNLVMKKRNENPSLRQRASVTWEAQLCPSEPHTGEEEETTGQGLQPLSRASGCPDCFTLIIKRKKMGKRGFKRQLATSDGVRTHCFVESHQRASPLIDFVLRVLALMVRLRRCLSAIIQRRRAHLCRHSVDEALY